MKSLASDLIALLGKGVADQEVRRAIADHALRDVYDDPPFCRYIGSKGKGVDLLFENDRAVDVQIHVQPTKVYSEFAEPLPFGLRKGMNQAQVDQLLGKSQAADEFDSQYLLHDGQVRLTVVYDKQGVVRYLSVGLPLDNGT